MRRVTKQLLAASSLGGLFLTVPALAQAGQGAQQAGSDATSAVSSSPAPADALPADTSRNSSSTGVAEIIVTAQRRGESLQKVPIAVTALTSDAITERGLSGSNSLEGVVPNLSVTRIGGVNQPYLRGVGSDGAGGFDEKSVATYVDGFYIAAPSSTQMSFNNLARIEVLKGPQGTLFGRNATGGVIQIVTKDPTEDFHANFDVGYGNYDTFDGNAYVTGGIASGLAADLAVQYHNQGDGFGTNLTTGSEVNKDRTTSIRSKWVYTGASTKITLFGDYEKVNSSGFAFRLGPNSSLTSGANAIDRFDIRMNDEPNFITRNYFLGLRIEQDLGFANFISSSFYGNNRLSYDSDITTQDGTAISLLYADTLEKAKQYSQEFQLQGQSGGALSWQIGTYLFRYDYHSNLRLTGRDVGPETIISDRGRKESASFYGQGTYELATDLKLTAGLRYTIDKQKTYDGLISLPTVPLNLPSADRRSTNKKPTWRLALDYQINPDVLAYVSYNRGIKSGGISVTALDTDPYNPEQLDAYEVGLKTQLFDRAVRFNVAGFYYDYKDLQVSVVDSTGTSARIFNAATARVYGLDADIEVRPFENLTLSGGIGLLDAKYRSFPGAPAAGPDGSVSIIDAGGNRMINAPKVSGSVSATYTIPTSIGDFRINGTAIHKSKAFAIPSNVLGYPSYTLFNALIGWTSSDGKLGIDVWGRNLFNEVYYPIRVPVPPISYAQVDGPPRTYGVRLKVNF